MRKDPLPSSDRHRESAANRPCQAPLAAWANFPQLSRLLEDASLMRDRSMNLRPLHLVFSDAMVVLALILSGCATGSGKTEQGSLGEEEFNDPFEDTNRAIFDFNQFVDRNAIVPVAK